MELTDPRLPVDERIRLLDRRELQILEDVKNLDISLRDNESKIQDILLDWALVIEEEHVLGRYVKPVNTICSRIIHILKENGLDSLTKYVYALPEKFKQMKFANAGLFSSATRSTPFKTASDAVESELDNYRELEKEEYIKNMLSTERKFPVYLPPNTPLEFLSNDEIRRRHELIKEAKSRLREEQSNLEEIIREKNVALIDHELVQHESIERPEARETVFYVAVSDSIKEMESFINTLEQLREKVLQFPPNDTDAQKYADSYKLFVNELIRGLNEFIRPLKDLKWTQSWKPWWKTAILEIDHGKHASAKMSSTKTHKGELRCLTREQVGDSKERVFKQALAFCKMVETFDLLTEYHDRYIKPRVADRKIRLSGILSDKA